jgi:hypothetical protein
MCALGDFRYPFIAKPRVIENARLLDALGVMQAKWARGRNLSTVVVTAAQPAAVGTAAKERFVEALQGSSKDHACHRGGGRARDPGRR